MPSNNQEPKEYDKENHLTLLHGLVDGIKKEWPNKNIYVDKENIGVV